MKLVLGAATLATSAALLIPAGAIAAEKPSTTSVARHVHRASHSLKRLRVFVASGKNAKAVRELKLARHEVARASRLTRKLGKHAHSAKARTRAAQAAGDVATEYDAVLHSVAGLLGTAGGGTLQSGLGAAILPALNGREQALALLQSLIDALPADLRAGLTDPFTSVAEGGSSLIDELTGLLEGDASTPTGLPDDLTTVVSQAISSVSASIEAGMARLSDLVALLPADAQGPMTDALTQLKASLAAITAALTDAAPQIAGQLGSLGTTLATELQQMTAIFSRLAGTPLSELTSGGFDFPLPSFLGGQPGDSQGNPLDGLLATLFGAGGGA